MNRTTGFDKLIFIIALALLFSLGIHIGRPRRNTAGGSVLFTVSVTKSWGSPSSAENLGVDGRIRARLLFYDGQTARFAADGDLLEAGFLIGGAKYISPNQPIRIYGETAGIEGIISSVCSESADLGGG